MDFLHLNQSRQMDKDVESIHQYCQTSEKLVKSRRQGLSIIWITYGPEKNSSKRSRKWLILGGNGGTELTELHDLEL